MEFSSNADSRADDAACGPDLLEGSGEQASWVALVPDGETRGRVLARLLDGSPLAIVASDDGGRVVALNRAFADLCGVPASGLLSRPVVDLAPAHLRGALRQAFESSRSKAENVRLGAEWLRPTGEVVPVEMAVAPDRDARGEVAGAYAFVYSAPGRKAEADDADRGDTEERYRRLYDEAPVGYHEVDLDGRIVNVNRTECELLGYPREQIIGRHVFDFVAEEYREASRRAFAEKVTELPPLKTLERTLINGQGQRVLVQIEERYKRDERGRVVGLFSTLQDITQRRRDERAAQASERRARALFEGIEEAVFVHDLDGQILDANPAASRLLGYSREELLALRTSDIDEPTFAEGFRERLARQMAAGHMTCEGRHRTKDGRVIPVEINTSAVQLDEQRAILAVLRDISERLALEETRHALAEAQERNALEMAAKNAELILSEARYRQLTEGCLDGVVVADRFGVVTMYNPAAERMFGYPESEIMGRPVSLLFPGTFTESDGSDRSFVDDVMRREPGLVGKTVELHGRRKGGEDFPLELSLSAIDRGGDLQFIGSVRDQTERQKMRALLAQSEKLASIGLLSANVAHEINNPLAYVGNNIAVLERDLAGVLEMIAVYESALPTLESAAPEAFQKVKDLAEDFGWDYVRENLPRMLSRTREGVQRVSNIVSNLRGLARTAPPKTEPAHVPDLLEGALEMIRGRLRRGRIEMTVEHGDVPPVSCVPSQICQVILNLLVNATQAIEAANPENGGRLKFASSVEGQAVSLAITDNGCGIDPSALPKLFDLGYTTKGVGEGTGLGLSICHGIVNGHGGRIEVESTPGVGSTFRIILPLETT